MWLKIHDMVFLPSKMLYIESKKALVFADLHLGIEYAYAEEGLFVPPVQFKRILNDIQKAIKLLKPKTIIINGDLKHKFEQRTIQEYYEVVRMLEFLMKTEKNLILVRGNHDTFVRGILRKYGVEVEETALELGAYLITHGHKNLDLNDYSFKTLILAHEHPALLLMDEAGNRERVPCFLYGQFEDINVIVLPAMTPFGGTDINVPGRMLLSPILRKFDVDRMEAIIATGSLVSRFCSVSKLTFLSSV